MSVKSADSTVRTSIVVEAPIERAFSVFTEGMPSWWPPQNHLVEGFERMIVEPRVGGVITDVGAGGVTSTWARVLAYEPPALFVFSWDISPQWQIETDPAKTSEVEVTFTAQGPERTLVELEHRHIERHGQGWEGMRDAVGGASGWNLERYAAVAGGGSV